MLMREIELGKLFGEHEDAAQNIVKFIGCVTTESKRLLFFCFLFFPQLFIFNSLLSLVWKDSKRTFLFRPKVEKLHIHDHRLLLIMKVKI